MNAFALGGLLTFIACVIVAVVVLLKHPHHMVHRIFIFLTVMVGIWGFGSFRIGLIEDQTLSLLWWKIAHIGVILVPVSFFHFIFAFVEKKEKWPIWLAYGFGIFFLIALIQGHLIKNVEWVFNSFYYDGRPPTMLYTIFTISWWVAVIYAHILLFFNLRKATSLKREQTKYLFLAVALGFAGGITCFLPVFGLNIYPFGNMLVPLYPIISGYAIIRHHLMDIDIVFKKSIIYSILIALVTLFYLFLIFISEKFFQGVMGYNSTFMSLGTMLIIAILFTPLKERIQRFVDHRFFKGSLPKMAEENIFLRKELADKEKFKAVAVMASGMAHEIKNPLTAIKTFSEYISVKRNDQEFVDKFSKIVSKEVDRINNLVHRLLDFARPSALNLQEVNLHELLNDVLTFLSSELVRYRVRVETNFVTSEFQKLNSDSPLLSDESPHKGDESKRGGQDRPAYLENNGALMLTADQNQLRQVFLNLFNNAIEAMTKGGTLTVETCLNRDPRLIGVVDRRESPAFGGAGVLITIQDTGPGITKDDLKEIFNPFFTTKEHGTGLGLAVTKGIIEEHKGKIRVESEIGKGTRFVIELPGGNT